jgi:hypothetical protein
LVPCSTARADKDEPSVAIRMFLYMQASLIEK